MKKWQLAAAVGALLGVVLFTTVGGTVAYLTDERYVENAFSFGSVAVEVVEDGFTGGQARTPVVPGASVAKDPAVYNAGQTPCYVRATVTIADAPGMENTQTLSRFIQLTGANTSDWTLGAGSWDARQFTVYYTKDGGVLAAKDTTSPIFTGFTLLAQTAEGESLLQGANEGFDIIVRAQAVQAIADDKTITSPQSAFAQLMPNTQTP